jgi:acyl-CoA synthetase (AMP-forming)/AMP-acid ligase II
MLTHRNMLADARIITDWFGFDSGTRMNCILPLFHVNAEVVTTITPLWFGGSVVLTQRFSPGSFWKTIERYRVNVVSVVPTILWILAARAPPKARGIFRPFASSSAAPRRFRRKFNSPSSADFGIPVFEGYGLSETTCYSSFNPPDLAKRKVGSVGVAVGNEMCILDDDCNPVPDGELGEICIAGENVMTGYYKMPEADANGVRRRMVPLRRHRIPRRGRFLLHPRSQEGHDHPRGRERLPARDRRGPLPSPEEIRDAATIGVPHPMYGEEPKSYVVVKDGESARRPRSDGVVPGEHGRLQVPARGGLHRRNPKGRPEDSCAGRCANSTRDPADGSIRLRPPLVRRAGDSAEDPARFRRRARRAHGGSTRPRCRASRGARRRAGGTRPFRHRRAARSGRCRNGNAPRGIRGRRSGVRAELGAILAAHGLGGRRARRVGTRVAAPRRRRRPARRCWLPLFRKTMPNS